jgi:hypothetical protein
MTFHDKIVILCITLFNNELSYDIDENTFQMRFAAMIILSFITGTSSSITVINEPVPIFLYRGDTAAD